MNKYIIGATLVVALFSCKQNSEPISEETIATESKKANDFFEASFKEDVSISPMLQTQLGVKTNYGEWDDFSNQAEAKELERAKNRLAYLNDSLNVNALNKETALSYTLYKQDLEHTIEDYAFRLYNYPVNQMHGMHAEIPAFLINMHSINSVEDAEAYISRLKGLEKVYADVSENLGIRETNGIMPPKFVFEKVIGDSKNLIKGRPFEKSNEVSALMEDFTTKVNTLSISKDEKEDLLNKAEKALTEQVRPAFEGLISTMQDQQQRATVENGVWKFPKGDQFYNLALKRTTTTSLTANEIHEIGLNEVARIHKEMEQIMQDVGFNGTLQDFFKFMREDEKFYYKNTVEDKQAYKDKATAIINTMKGTLDKLFNTKPKAELVVKAVEPFREKSAGKAFYQQPAIDGSRPGTYYVNLYDMSAMPTYQMEALAYHEGIPGHHMQIAISQELENIPAFRKHSFYTAYVEGWALYSEYIPKEVGYYNDPYSDFGRLAMELWRSCRLVVDTGIHAKKWTREEGIEYYKKNTPNAESDCIKMVERHIVMPGQATAYKVGMNKILELRNLSEEKLGSNFNIKEFHDIILKDGALPLDILTQKVEAWIASK